MYSLITLNTHICTYIYICIYINIDISNIYTRNIYKYISPPGLQKQRFPSPPLFIYLSRYPLLATPPLSIYLSRYPLSAMHPLSLLSYPLPSPPLSIYLSSTIFSPLLYFDLSRSPRRLSLSIYLAVPSPLPASLYLSILLSPPRQTASLYLSISLSCLNWMLRI